MVHAVGVTAFNKAGRTRMPGDAMRSLMAPDFDYNPTIGARCYSDGLPFSSSAEVKAIAWQLMREKRRST